jgi:hydroxymethylbilane synthase
LPTDEAPGLSLAAVPERGSLADTLVCRKRLAFQELPVGAAVGTGSLRRRAQMLHLRPDLKMKELRGNVDTRLRKLAQGDYDAIVLAEAGLLRLGLVVDDPESTGGRFSVRARLVSSESEGDAVSLFAERLGPPEILPAVGQGALGLETRRYDLPVREAVERLNDPATWGSVLAERAMLAALHGGCLAPIAAWGRPEGGALVLTGRVLSADGAQRIEVSLQADLAQPAQLGQRVADELISQGATALIEAARGRA